jgi:hypothetical protein
MFRRPRQSQPPSARNLLIYHELAHGGRRQIDVAKAYGLSQCRVSSIARKVQAWVERILFASRSVSRSPGERLHLAIAKERIRLIESIDPLLETLTLESGEVRYIRRSVAIEAGQPVTTVEISNSPPARLLEHAMNISDRLSDLEHIARLGPLADLPALYFQQQAAEHATPSARANRATNSPILEVQVGQSGPPKATIHIENQGRGELLAPHSASAGSPLNPMQPTTCAVPPAAG